METRQIKIIGMHCQGCVKNITALLSALPGVHAVEVVLDAGEATIRFDPAKTDAAQFAATIEAAGFELA